MPLLVVVQGRRDQLRWVLWEPELRKKGLASCSAKRWGHGANVFKLIQLNPIQLNEKWTTRYQTHQSISELPWATHRIFLNIPGRGRKSRKSVARHSTTQLPSLPRTLATHFNECNTLSRASWKARSHLAYIRTHFNSGLTMCNKYGGPMCTLVFANAPYSFMKYCEACNFGCCAHIRHVHESPITAHMFPMFFP